MKLESIEVKHIFELEPADGILPLNMEAISTLPGIEYTRKATPSKSGRPTSAFFRAENVEIAPAGKIIVKGGDEAQATLTANSVLDRIKRATEATPRPSAPNNNERCDRVEAKPADTTPAAESAPESTETKPEV